MGSKEIECAQLEEKKSNLKAEMIFLATKACLAVAL